MLSFNFIAGAAPVLILSKELAATAINSNYEQVLPRLGSSP